MSAVWTPNDYSNIITIGAAAVGSVLLIVFKSRCKNIKLWGGSWEGGDPGKGTITVTVIGFSPAKIPSRIRIPTSGAHLHVNQP